MTGRVYWLTGLSGAGKSTLGRRLAEWLREQGRSAVLLDGDELRGALGAGAAFARGDRLALAACYGRLCRLLALQGVDVVIATISLFHEVQRWNRENLPGYIEVLLEVPLGELSARDPHGLYAAARAGAADVAGVDQPVEMPERADIVLRHRPGLTAERTFAELLVGLRQLSAAG